MQHLLSIALLVSLVAAQGAEDATELLRRVLTTAENTKNWRAEVVRVSQLTIPGTNNLPSQSEVRTRIAVQAPLKMARQNSGNDRTIFVCDGVETLYSGDGHSYYKGNANVTPQCDFPLNKFYELESNPLSISFVGRDHVRLGSGDRECVLVRATWKRDTFNIVGTMCIDPAAALILRDVRDVVDDSRGIRSITTTTFIDYESNPTLPPDTFQFSIPLGAVEAKHPN